MVIAVNGPSNPSQRQTSEIRKCKSVSKVMQDASFTHGYYKSIILPIDISYTVHIWPANRLMRTSFGTSTGISLPSRDGCGLN